ncbi:hypothetical protein N2152v2_004922 [Parachlorella kessleri]
MKVFIIGAGGRLGSRILAASVRAGHDTTAFVRSSQRLRAAIGDELFSRVAVVEGDALDSEQLKAAMQGHEVAVQTAGYIGDTPEEAQRLHSLVRSTAEAANEALVGPRRFWALGGAGALDLPGRAGMMLVDIPGFPMPKYRIHKTNFAYLSQEAFASLDWSFACPGAMVDKPQAAEQQPGVSTVPAAHVSVDVLPVQLPAWAALLPNAMLLPAIAAIKGQLVGPSYEEVAEAIVAHLAGNGPLKHHRVGFYAAQGATGSGSGQQG